MDQQNDLVTETRPDCYMCGGSGITLYRDCSDRLFGVPGTWTFKQCTNVQCGLIWLDPRPTQATIGEAYRNYYTHDSDRVLRTGLASVLRPLLQGAAVRFLGLYRERRRYKHMYLDCFSPGRLLEVGCGNGKRLERMRALGWDVMGQEIDAVAASHVQASRGIPVHLGELETLDESDRYDVVLLSHVIEHVYEPLILLQKCRKLLKPGGYLIILTPNVASLGHRRFGAVWRGLEPPRHLHLFNSNALQQLVYQAGFNIHKNWTTLVGAFAIAENSGPDCANDKSITVRDVLRGFMFQLMAGLVYLRDKHCGEECVVMAIK